MASHIFAHGPRVGSMSDGVPPEHDRWTIRCTRCGRQVYRREDMEAVSCGDS